jgi:hypothetical protein
MPAPTVTAINPVDGSESLPLETQFSVTFSAEMDRESVISNGHVVVTGSASKVVIAGPDSMNFSGDVGQDFLSSRKMSGPTDGVITTSDGLSFLFTPSAPLEPNSKYKVLISTGVTSRTIGDVVAVKDAATTGKARIKGSYTGAANSVVTVTILTTGGLGAATYSATLTDGTVLSTGATDRVIAALSGIRLEFNAGTYTQGDTYTATLTSPEALAGIYTASFTTGDPTYVKVPEVEESFELVDHTISGEERVSSILVGPDAPLMIRSISPIDETIGLSLNTRSITLTFNKDIDPASLSDAKISLLMESLPTNVSEQLSTPLDLTAEISGSKLIINFN